MFVYERQKGEGEMCLQTVLLGLLLHNLRTIPRLNKGRSLGFLSEKWQSKSRWVPTNLHSMKDYFTLSHFDFKMINVESL